MDNAPVKLPLPGYAIKGLHDGVHLAIRGESSLIVYGLKQPRQGDGEQWLRVIVERIGERRTDDFSITLDKRSAKLLRDKLVAMYGPG